MKCPTCVSENERSIVHVRGSRSGQLPKDHYFDEDGEEHIHNPNVVVTEYECSNHHRFAERSSWQCHVCGYKACEAEIVVAPPTLIGHTASGAEVHSVRTSSGKVITSAERKALNERKGR